MKTVQMTLDEGLVDAVDKAAKRIGTTRSAFAREALRAALGKVQVKEMEQGAVRIMVPDLLFPHYLSFSSPMLYYREKISS